MQLARPERERWQPLRSGFLNLYRYDREEFQYENGRLLLRGNNGTGKSRVLALQLPFLLDGEVVPQRLEPDADPAKRIEWNLLMDRYPDRTGYTWIEFGRRGPNGEEHYVTLGCGLNAVENQSGVRKWFFITTQRVGVDLELASDSQQVFGKDRLRERIGAAGQVFEDAAAYRRAVNAALFRLDHHRYASLMNLLIQLRRPQLTRRLDENQLSAALSEALPPVSSTVITNVAEAFRNLESDRASLESFKAAAAAVDRFLTGYGHYAEVAARRRADRVRAAHYEYEAGMKEILISEADCDRSLAELARLKTELQRLSVEQQAVQAEITALQQSPQMKDAHALERSHREAKEKRREAESAALEVADAAQVRTKRSEEHVRIKTALEQCHTRLIAAIDAAAQAASAAGLAGIHRECIGLLDMPHAVAEPELKKARESVEVAIQAQIGKIEHVRRLNERILSARIDLQQGITQRDQLSGLLDDARERLNGARQDHQSATGAFLAAAADWSANLTELRLPGNDAVLSMATAWCESPDVSSPVTAAIRKAVEEAIKSLAERRAQLEQVRKAQIGELELIHIERDRLTAGDATPPPRMRGASERTDRPGAPLWLLCDFVEDLDVESRAGFEAALEAAGLLDAWVTPSGELLDPDSHDVMLVASTSPLPPEDAHLGTILAPSPAASGANSPVAPYVLADILRHIGAKPDSAHTWISSDGRWQNGPVAGRWNKAAAEYIGQQAREMARWKQILELDAAITEVQARLDLSRSSAEELDQCERAARSEMEAAPADEPVRSAYGRADAVAREVEALRNRLAEAEGYAAQKQSRLNEAIETREHAIVDLGIAKWADDLDSLERSIGNYRLTLALFWFGAEAFREARSAGERAWKLVEEGGSRERRQKEIADRLERSALSAEIAYDTVRQAVGADFDQILLRLEQARRQLDELRIQDKEARRNHHDTELAVTRVDERLRNRTEMLNGQTDRRNTAASSLRAFACTKLLQLATPGFVDEEARSWSSTRTVEVAFELSSRLQTVESSDQAWEHHQKSVPAQFHELMRTLSAQGCQPSARFSDDVFVATAQFQGRECTMEELRHVLTDEVSTRRMLLDAREREILENHLAGEVSGHLHELLTAAEEQVRQMNLELDGCPMSNGMKLRFAWRGAEDGPLGLVEVRRRLLRSSGTWSSADCRMLGAFLQQQIQTVCTQLETGTWQESLAEALDYRKWHRFAVERYQDGAWKRLTRRTHGTGSGGEKAVALTLPHFAAAAAFYRTAHPLAPRLILLDEAFVGIDADMRAKCMGLINTFDLDFMMTSEREWGCYPTLPGIAIYQLSTRPEIDAIGLTRWVWNGQKRLLTQDLANEQETESLV